VALADGNHVVRFTVNTLIDAEEHFGTFPDLFEALTTHRLRTARALLWLTGTAPTLEAAGDLLTGVPLADVLVALADALADALAPLKGDIEVETAADPTTEPVPTIGPSSSPSE
jgi:hypothetical protein